MWFNTSRSNTFWFVSREGGFRQEKYRKTKSPDGAEEYIPDGVVEIPDYKYMNTDQIYAATFGAVKKLIQIVESQQKEIEALKKQIDLKN